MAALRCTGNGQEISEQIKNKDLSDWQPLRSLFLWYILRNKLALIGKLGNYFMITSPDIQVMQDQRF